MHTGKILPLAALAAACIATTFDATGDPATALFPQGVVEDSGWALARLNDGSSPSNGTMAFRYPESSRPVRLYLIDSAVDNTSGWFDDNANLTFVKGLRIPGGGNPPITYDPKQEAATNDHGTRILSIIAGSELGVACGIPIELYSYDVYPDDSSDLGRLTSAIGRATLDKLQNPDTLGVVCIANSTNDPAINSELHAAIEDAIEAGLVVVVSAGNKGVDALNGHEVEDVSAHGKAAYLPAAYGSSLDGLITVGASDQDNEQASLSNHGDAVDLWAPGVDVLTFDLANRDDGQSSPMTGTSPAAAMVAAAAIAELSRQPNLSPAEVEAAIKLRLFEAEVNVVQLDDDLDGDGAVDELERFFGFAINDPASVPPSVSIAVDDSNVKLSFTIDESLWNGADPMTLADGTSWRLLSCPGFGCWRNVEEMYQTEVDPVAGPPVDGRVPITLTVPKDAPPCPSGCTPSSVFFRIEVIPNP